MRDNFFFGGGKLTALLAVLVLMAADAKGNGLRLAGQGASHRAEPAERAGLAPAPQAEPALVLPGGMPPGSYVLSGMIVHVADGDTVTLRAFDGQRHRIRMDSIDAPELEHGAGQPGQPYAGAARRFLAERVAGKRLTAHCYEQDRYGRDVCALMLPDGRSVNRLQVEAGYAWAYTARRGRYLRDRAMPDLQRQARAAGRGLWAGRHARQPWKWRYDCWRQRQCG